MSRLLRPFLVLAALALALALALAAAPASAQDVNPVSLLEQAGSLLPGEPGADEGPRLDTTVSILLLLTVLSLAPAVLVMCTCFTRIVIVLGLLRQAMGTAALPPTQVITGLALLLTFLVMAPAFERVRQEALVPYQAGEITQLQAWENAKQPLRDFMFDQIDHADNWDGVYMMLEYQGVDLSEPENLVRGDVDMLALVPAFVLSELKIAFLMGFRLYLPFLIIDMVISSILISMGMMMLPPVLISLPFKLLLFVLVDGWRLVVGGLLESFKVAGVSG
ncbi:flagellar type III secretion system pore protein FliP [Phycisphaera mikurensis]|uniref:Flagellar biosynthetic protein FliP n=1 Tax=Phycisphaera mikurensis (strain NBRC 102666 / KCTC 22515 / FYK2301M01) TaxID=1142394 RepID=I0IGX3_PHYMF|nr:flagellar type III secretion system pore protein FliP [Phycisphaera mikurensis]MBB6440768.1 flagellar biosynthetic protein FliP [Phycisphaera mikurensis]BAM04511.1 flagellar biosynthetic protein FliP [Phycisphaera mikurensis NBRC 102666]